jgi:hypothetical protein
MKTKRNCPSPHTIKPAWLKAGGCCFFTLTSLWLAIIKACKKNMHSKACATLKVSNSFLCCLSYWIFPPFPPQKKLCSSTTLCPSVVGIFFHIITLQTTLLLKFDKIVKFSYKLLLWCVACKWRNYWIEIPKISEWVSSQSWNPGCFACKWHFMRHACNQ